MSIDDEIYDGYVDDIEEDPIYCSKCSKRIFSLMAHYTIHMDTYCLLSICNFRCDGTVYLCKKCFRRTKSDWIRKPPIQRPKEWRKILFAPTRAGNCDNCAKEEILYMVEFPNGKNFLGLDKHEKRFFCKNCMAALAVYLKSR